MYIPVTRFDGRCRFHRNTFGISRTLLISYTIFRSGFWKLSFSPNLCRVSLSDRPRVPLSTSYAYPHYFSRIAFSYLFENHTRFTRQHFPMCGRIVEFLTESKFSRNIRASFFFLLSFRRSYFQRFYRSYKYYIDINSYFYKTDTPLRYFKSQTSHK